MNRAATTTALFLAGALSPTLAMCAPTPPGCTLPSRAVSVSGNHLTLNGATWLPRGTQIRGFISSYQTASDNNSVQPQPSDPAYDGSWLATMNAQNAYENDMTAEFNAIKSWGIDELRFQVSQPGLDAGPAGNGNSTSTWTAPVDLTGVPLYKTDYLTRLVKAINNARCAGFVVILSMQDEPRTGDQWPNVPSHQRLPLSSLATERAWAPLVNEFGASSDVLFEIYNEPGLAVSSANWSDWAHRNDTNAAPTNEAGIIGMGPMVNYLRGIGAQNTVIMDGLEIAHRLDGIENLANLPNDPLNKILYAVHPYPAGSAAEPWQTYFGNWHANHPVIADEWSAGAGGGTTGTGLQQLSTFKVAVDLLNYLKTQKIPLSSGAYDVPGVMTQDLINFTPTNYNNYTQEISNPNSVDNAGLLVKKMLTNNYTVSVTCNDGVTSGNDPGCN